MEGGGWSLPPSGLLEFDYVYFKRNDPMGDREFDVMVEELQRPVSQLETVELFRIACSGGDTFFLTASMLSILLHHVEDGETQHQLLRLMADKVYN